MLTDLLATIGCENILKVFHLNNPIENKQKFHVVDKNLFVFKLSGLEKVCSRLKQSKQRTAGAKVSVASRLNHLFTVPL